MHYYMPWILFGAVALLAVCGSMAWSLQKERHSLGRQKADLTRLSLAANKTDNAVIVLNEDGEIDWVNEGFTRLSGYSYPDAMGKTPAAILLGALQSSKAGQQIRSGLSGKKHFTVEMLCLHKNGHRYWLWLSCTPLYEQERMLGYVAIAADITARKRTEEELLRVHQRNELLLTAAGEGIFGLDLQGSITFVNPAAARLTGWDAGELIGKPASTILQQVRSHKNVNAQTDAFLAAAFQDGLIEVGDVDLFRRKDNATFPVEYTSTPIREGSNLLGTVVIFRDITDRKRTEGMRVRQTRQSALRADVAFALAISDTLPSVLQKCAQAFLKHLEAACARIWTHNTDEDLLELQASAGLPPQKGEMHSRIPVGRNEVGRIAKERVPHTIYDLMSDPQAGDRDWMKREKLQSFAGFPLTVENKLVGVIGTYFHGQLPDDALELLSAIVDSVGQGIVRKRIEDKVAEQAALLDKSQDAIVVIDLNSRVTYWNKSAERLYGWSTKDVSSKRVDELIFRDTSQFDRVRTEVMEKSEWKGELCQVTRGDEPVIVESHWTLIQDDIGRAKSILLVNTNVSERKKIEAQFLRTQRMESIGTLAGGIAHDLNNVLAPIMMSVEILKQKYTDEQSRRMLGIVEASAKRGADMVKQVLTFARGVDGERVLLQSKHLIKEVGKITNETFPKTIQIRINVPDNLWPIMGDATQLHQVLVNLAVNARDAMPNGGVLTLSAENTVVEPSKSLEAELARVDLNGSPRPGFYVLVKVGDTGTGISSEVLDKIFEPFFTTKEMGKGTGLGLATVLGIVKSHNGFVQVQTELKKGTTFLIYLPALEAGQTQPTDSEHHRLPSGRGELILAVDDEVSVLSMTKEMLETHGYRVITAKDGPEAVAAFSAHRDEIKGVLTDMLMPFMDGPATIRVLKRLDPNVKVIAASGLMDSEKVKDATGMDNIAFLMKPFTAEKLLNTIHRVIHETNGHADAA
jgi:two-component system cell cycle sensor histidine kinase/response regulator CckA